MTWVKRILTVIILLVIIYVAGPKPSAPVYSTELPLIPANPAALELYVTHKETQAKLKPDNNAAIIWSDSLHHRKTPYAIVYLHGFSASRQEGNPVHTDMAKRFGCNLYLSRLAEHGIDTTDALINLTADKLWESAKEALAIGRQLGDRVIIMGTSTGGSLALQLAADYPDIAALVLLSPNIAINNPNAGLINDPWGLQIARIVTGSKYNTANNNSTIYKRYWYYTYRLEGAVQLQEYLETAMIQKTFSAVRQPVLSLYYYKDKQHQDPVVKVSAMHDMMKSLGTFPGLKREQAIPQAGNHVLGFYAISKDIPAVENAISNFLTQVVRVQPVAGF